MRAWPTPKNEQEECYAVHNSEYYPDAFFFFNPVRILAVPVD